MVIFLRKGKTYTAKTSSDDFKVNTPENSLLLQQAITSKGILVPYTNLQFNPYSNTQLDLFCSDNLSFSMHGSQYVTNQSMRRSSTRLTHQLEKECWLQSFSVHHMMKITKLLSHKTQWRTNAAASLKEKWIRENFVFGHNLLEQNFASHLRDL